MIPNIPMKSLNTIFDTVQKASTKLKWEHKNKIHRNTTADGDFANFTIGGPDPKGGHIWMTMYPKYCPYDEDKRYENIEMIAIDKKFETEAEAKRYAATLHFQHALNVHMEISKAFRRHYGEKNAELNVARNNLEKHRKKLKKFNLITSKTE